MPNNDTAAAPPGRTNDPSTTVGRDNSRTSEKNFAGAQAPLDPSCQHTAGVVIRAYVEHLGMAGDTELTVNVKWPASTFCVQGGTQPAVQAGQTVAPHVPPTGPEATLEALFGQVVAHDESSAEAKGVQTTAKKGASKGAGKKP